MKVAKVKESDLQEFFERTLEKLEEEKWTQVYHSLPSYCEECRQLNDIQNTELERNGNRGRFTGAAGFSNDGHLFQGDKSVHARWRGIMPKSLRFSMMSLTDNEEFWSKGNKKEWRRFIRDCVFDQTLDPRHFIEGYWKKRLEETTKVKVGYGANA